MALLALELIALITLFAADDFVHDRSPTATWATSSRVIAATALAVAIATWAQSLARSDIF